MLELLNKLFFRLELLLVGRNCPNCNTRKSLGTGFLSRKEGKMVFSSLCYHCFAFYNIVDGKMSFVEFFAQDDLEK
jgi:hypothetical protein